MWLEPASCQRVDVVGGVAAVLPFADAAFRFVVVVAAGAAWAAAAAPARAEAAGAGSPRDSASSRRRVLMMSSRDAICRWSDAIKACSAVGGAGGGWAGRLPPLPPLERERERLRAAAPPLLAAGGVPARKGASAAPRAVRTSGRCRRAASWVATPAWSPIVRRARGREKGKTQVRRKKEQEDCGSARQPHHVQVHNKRPETQENTAQNMLYISWMVILGDHGIVSKKQVSKTSILELPRVKNCISRLCTHPLGDAPPPPDLRSKYINMP